MHVFLAVNNTLQQSKSSSLRLPAGHMPRFSTPSAHNFDLQASRTLKVPLWGANFQGRSPTTFCLTLRQNLHPTSPPRTNSITRPKHTISFHPAPIIRMEYQGASTGGRACYNCESLSITAMFAATTASAVVACHLLSIAHALFEWADLRGRVNALISLISFASLTAISGLH